jgi:GntR family transcriptional regulator of arabinose operon
LTNPCSGAIINDMNQQAVSTSKHRQIREWIRESIESGRFRPGDKLPSEAELCRRFQVSRNSVRQAISYLVNDGWLESRKGIGTFCLLKTRRLSRDIGLICFYSGSYIFPRISRGCDRIAHSQGFHILLNQSEYDCDKEREILLKLQKRGVDGIIIEPYYGGEGRSNAALLREMEDSGIPVVLVDNYFPEQDFTRIAMDDRQGGRLAAEYLYDRGHRRIGILADKSYYPKTIRKQGALSVLAERGVAVAPEWVLDFEGPVSSGRAFEVVDAYFSQARDLPTAFICTSDEESMEIYKAAEKRGLGIPADISVVSFDNSNLAELPGISLTSVNHPGQYMGELAARILLEKIIYPEVACRTTSLIQPRLVERSSVAEIESEVE